MKHFSAFLIVFFWLLATIAIVVTLVGVLLLLAVWPSWAEIPERALKAFDR